MEINNKYALVDIGANLTSKQLSSDLNRILSEAQSQQVSTIIITGTSESGSRDAYLMASKHKGFLYSTAGVHPHDAKNFSPQTLAALKDLASHPEVVSLGECGLDYDRMFSPAEVQREIKLAGELKKPLFLHERSAHADFVDILEKHLDKNVKACVHCFTGTEQELKKYLAMGLYIGITGWVCDQKRGDTLRRIVKLIPKDRLMIETDAPYLSPQNMPKFVKRNQPAFLPYVLKQLAESMGIAPEELARATTANACAFFGISPNAAKQGRDAFQKQATSAGNNTNSSSSNNGGGYQSSQSSQGGQFDQPRKVCPYFNSPAGCRRGFDCRMLHDNSTPPQQQSSQQQNAQAFSTQSQQQSQSEPKVCPFYLKGNCKKGDTCNMSHQQQQQFNPPQRQQQFQPPQQNFNQQNSQQPEPRLPKPCPYYKKGECKKGDECNMSHQQQPQSLPTQQQQFGQQQQSQPEAKVCPYYLKGNCKKGDTCNMSHQQQQQQSVQQQPRQNQQQQSQNHTYSRQQNQGQSTRQSQQQTVNSGQQQEAKVCPYWLQGNCKKGDTCNMSHQQHQQHQSVQQQQPEAKLCPFYLKGNCKKGDTCNMSHQQQQQHQSVQQQQPEAKLCPFYLKGNCKKGDTCNMSHQQQQQQQFNAPQRQQQSFAPPDFNAGSGPSDKPCSFYKKGTCKKGDQCNFLHI